jgi:T5SS/PEP-CTERM-associated repeat protein
MPWPRCARSDAPNLLCLALLLSTINSQLSTAFAQVVNDGATNTLLNITNTFAGDVTVGTNGPFTLLVLSDNAFLSNSVNGTIGLNTTAKSNEVRLLSPTARWQMGSLLSVGSNGSFNRLVVSNGAAVRDTIVGFVGVNASASNNLALVTGSGSSWNAGQVWLGVSGMGNQLVVSNGGMVVGDYGYAGVSSSSNLAVVTGSGSLWSNVLDLQVGNSGAGNQLLVSSGGNVHNGAGYVGVNASASNNLAMVAGSGSVWSNALDLNIGYFAANNNQMIVSNGAAVFAAGNGLIGQFTNANGNSVIVTDPGTRWLLGNNLYVGSNGALNRLVLSNGATVSASGDSYIGYNPGSTGNLAVVTGAGSVWSNANSLYVGAAGPANRMVLSSGGVAKSLFGELGDFTGSDSNVVQVTDAGSVWDSTLLYVGFHGRGNRLLVTNGGFVSSVLSSIGSQVSANGNEVVVTGTGSVWSNRLFEVGSSGSGNQLTITNGGAVLVVDTNSTSTSLLIGTSLTATNSRVTVNGGTLRVIGTNGTGMLDVRHGTNVFNAGTIEADQLLLTNTQGFFEFNGGTLITRGASINNNFVVGKAGTTPAVWDVRSGGNHLVGGQVIIGDTSSFNQLILTNGGLLTNSGLSVLGQSAGANSNSATIAGAGSRWFQLNGVVVGGLGSGNRLAVSNGATFLNSGGSSYIGNDLVSSDNDTVITGPGTMWTSSSTINVGEGGHDNRFLVSDGAQVTSFSGTIGDLFAGTSNNIATVTGAGSLWTADTFNIGFSGAGNQLVVSNSGLAFASNAVYLGLLSTSTKNRLTVDGGTLRVTNAAASGLLEIRRGTNVLNAGLIEADVVRMTNTPSGVLQFNGGILSARSSKISSGSLLTIGNGVSPATMFLAGNGLHDFSGNLIVTVSSNAVLSGNGTLVGGVSIASGATLIPGTSVGKMIFTNVPSLHGTVLMEISKNGTILTNDQVQTVIGTLTYGGALVVSNLGPTALANGDRFQLFNATNYSGSFSSLTLPPLATGLTWKNNLLVDGSLQVSGPSAIPISTLSFSGAALVYTQDFNSLAISGANLWRDDATLLGWYAARSVAPNPITNYLASDGSGNSGGLYSFGSTGSSDRALGSIASDSVGTIAYGLCFSNDTANSVSNFTITYTGEQWRDGGDFAVTNTLTVWYRVSPSVVTNPEPGLVTNWTQVTNLSFVSPTVLGTVSGGALDGNQATNQHAFSAVFISGLAVPPGQHVFFRWRDLNDSGGDQGMALDDLTIAIVVPTDRFWTNPLGGNYEVAANWLSNIVAQPLDTAHFTSNANYQVNWGTNALAANAYFDAAGGTVTQAIGAASWTLTGSYIVGRDAAATAAVTHASGILRVTNSVGTAVFKAGEAGRGTFNLTGGEVIADSLLVTNGSNSVFNFTGGALRSRNTTVNNGSRLTVGTNTTAGTFELLGGTHTFANGLTIQSNSLLAGTGDISANVTVNGSISPGGAQGGIGQLNFNSGALNFSSTTTNLFEINKAAGTNDTVTCVSIITLNGTLIVTNLGGTLTSGDQFQLFSGSFNFFGFQKLILPPLSAGLSWKNDTHKDGSIQIIQTPARDFGEDVSHFQGDISQSTWNQMFAEGKRFAFIKATEGLTGPNDLTMSNNVARAAAAGLLAGVYHLAHPENRPTTNGAISEATNFLSWAASAIGPGRLRPVLDLEFGSGLTTTELTDWVIAFSNEITNNRGPAAAPIIYTIQSFAQNELDSRLANYDLWLAAYSGGSDPQADDPPPFGLSTNATGVFNNWSFWQYSDTGSSGGISPLDLDVCHSEYKPLSSYLIPGPPPAPIQLSIVGVTGSGAFQLSFTNTPGSFFAVLATTNPSLPSSNWIVVGPAIETSPGQFQFTDPQATNNPQRFYRVRSP